MTSFWCGQVEGLFYNYFSVGLDARAAYGFHHLRETTPWAAPSRLINQAWYAYFSCASGWFCCAPPLNTTATLKVRPVLVSLGISCVFVCACAAVCVCACAMHQHGVFISAVVYLRACHSIYCSTSLTPLHPATTKIVCVLKDTSARRAPSVCMHAKYTPHGRRATI